MVFTGTVRLPRKAGLGAAAEWTFTGEIYSAADAKEVGLVHKIFPPEELMDHVRGVADLISLRAPIAVRSAKKAIVNGLGMTPDAAGAAEVEVISTYLIAYGNDRFVLEITGI